MSIQKRSFCPISALCSKFYPRNINYIPAVKFFAGLDLEQKSSFLDGHVRNDLKMIKDLFIKRIPRIIKALLVITVCIVGFIFEFIIELPFYLIVVLNERFRRKA
ncbi:MAG: hypothetical protein JRF71_00905 [Deltaproteobacteria bacterium]|nr:hypothetical protein [Deltaproteobacteria bacterium]